MYCFVRFQKGFTQRIRWKLPDCLIFLHHFQHLSLYSNQFTQKLNKLYTSTFRKNHSIYWWKPHENPFSSFRVFLPITLFICKKVHPIQIILSYAVRSKKVINSCILIYRLCSFVDGSTRARRLRRPM